MWGCWVSKHFWQTCFIWHFGWAKMLISDHEINWYQRNLQTKPSNLANVPGFKGTTWSILSLCGGRGPKDQGEDAKRKSFPLFWSKISRVGDRLGVYQWSREKNRLVQVYLPSYIQGLSFSHRSLDPYGNQAVFSRDVVFCFQCSIVVFPLGLSRKKNIKQKS